jgi:type II secretory pathway predicted ATPase ExeA
MRISAILVVTGASGSGKTTTVRALEARALPGVRCYYFDAVGVPAAGALEREFGSPGGLAGRHDPRVARSLGCQS